MAGRGHSKRNVNRLAAIDKNEHKLLSLEATIQKIERNVEFLLDLSTKTFAIVNKLCGNMSVSTDPIEFPISSVEEIESIEAKVSENPGKYIDLFRNLLLQGGFDKNISRLFNKSMLMSMNYSGTYSKLGLANYMSFNSALFESQKRDGYSYEDYRREVRTAIQKYKNKVYKAKSEAKAKLLKEQNAHNEVLVDIKKPITFEQNE